MTTSHRVERWTEQFPLIRNFSAAHLQIARGTVHFCELEAGAIAYELQGECQNYLMCIDGRTRVFRMSEAGREMLIHKVGAGDTCVLTTQCLLSGGNFPAESIAEARTALAAIPSDRFRQLMRESTEFRAFVLDDYTRLLASLLTLIEEIAFAPLEQQLARRLLVGADENGRVLKLPLCIHEIAEAFVIEDKNGRALSFTYFERGPGQPNLPPRFTKDQAREIARDLMDGVENDEPAAGR